MQQYDNVKEILITYFNNLNVFGSLLSENIKNIFINDVSKYFEDIISRIIPLWMVNIENIFKYFINNYRCNDIYNLLFYNSKEQNYDLQNDDIENNQLDCYHSELDETITSKESFEKGTIRICTQFISDNQLTEDTNITKEKYIEITRGKDIKFVDNCLIENNISIEENNNIIFFNKEIKYYHKVKKLLKKINNETINNLIETHEKVEDSKVKLRVKSMKELIGILEKDIDAEKLKNIRVLIPVYIFYRYFLRKNIDQNKLDELPTQLIESDILSQKDISRIQSNFNEAKKKLEKLFKQYSDYSLPELYQDKPDIPTYQSLMYAKLNKELLESKYNGINKSLELLQSYKKLPLTQKYKESTNIDINSFISQHECIKEQHKLLLKENKDKIKELELAIECETVESYEPEKLIEDTKILRENFFINEGNLKKYYKITV
jgi:hypothetical protein